MLLKKRKKKPGLKFNFGLAIIGLQPTGPRSPGRRVEKNDGKTFVCDKRDRAITFVAILT